jgi:hypothetical protein
MRIRPDVDDPDARLVVPFHHTGVVPSGGLGNLLPAYFAAVRLAQLAGMSAKIDAMDYENLRYDFSVPAPDPSEQFYGIRELEFYCRRCPLTTPYLQECAGVWLTADIAKTIQDMLKDKLAILPSKDVIIQFRCSDSHREWAMGLMPFEFYKQALSDLVNSSTTISILPDPKVARVGCCTAHMHVLQVALGHAFKCNVEILRPSTLSYDLALFVNARIFVGSPSTYGLFSAIANRGRAFLPNAPLLIKGRKPCLEGVQWIPTLRSTIACEQPVWGWFTSDERLRSFLSGVFKGAWFR